MTHDSITVRLGEQAHEVPQGSTLADLVAALGHAPNAVGTAINGHFVPLALRDRPLRPDDVVVLFRRIVGG